MKAICNLINKGKRKAILDKVALLALVLLAGASIVAAGTLNKSDEQRDQSKITTGSGERYKTTVERHTEGTLSPQDLHQTSLLASRIVNHLNDAISGMVDEDVEAAQSEIASAQTLTKVVRDLLPVTTITTVVNDAEGKEVYRDVNKVQNDKIPLYRGMIATEVVEPIVDAKEKEAALRGLRLADATVIHTSVLANLGYIERKLNRALALIEKPEEALQQLMLAQTRGIEMKINEADNPLVKVQHALRLAERMVEEGKHEAAKDNLRLAQFQLSAYRGIVDKDAAKEAKRLDEDITKLMNKTKGKEAAAKIREFWERSVSWFKEEQGQAHVVEEESSPTGDE
jgi:hypothetical protein